MGLKDDLEDAALAVHEQCKDLDLEPGEVGADPVLDANIIDLRERRGALNIKGKALREQPRATPPASKSIDDAIAHDREICDRDLLGYEKDKLIHAQARQLELLPDLNTEIRIYREALRLIYDYLGLQLPLVMTAAEAHDQINRLMDERDTLNTDNRKLKNAKTGERPDQITRHEMRGALRAVALHLLSEGGYHLNPGKPGPQSAKTLTNTRLADQPCIGILQERLGLESDTVRGHAKAVLRELTQEARFRK